MLFNKTFQKTLKKLFIATILLFGLSVLQRALGLGGYSRHDPAWEILLLALTNLIPICIFWWAVATLTGESKGSLIAFLVVLSGQIYSTTLSISQGYSSELAEQIFWRLWILGFCAYGLFGMIHFGHRRGLYMMIAYLVLTGVTIKLGAWEYDKMMNWFLAFADLEDLFVVRVPLSESSYRPINLFRLFIIQLDLILSVSVFWWVFTQIKYRSQLDLTMRKVSILPKLDRLPFSIIYWTFRIALLAAVLGTAQRIVRAEGTSVSLICQVACFILGIYVIGSIYRNFLTAYLVGRGHYPRWVYLGLQLPVLHILVWIYVVSRPAMSPPASLPPDHQSVRLPGVAEIQKKFVHDGRNAALKFLLIFLIVILSALSLLDGGSALSPFGQMSWLTGLIAAAVAIVLTILYFHHENTLFFLFGLQGLSIVIVLVFTPAEPSVRLLANLLNMVVLYSLFHFDRMTFVEDHRVKIEHT